MGAQQRHLHSGSHQYESSLWKVYYVFECTVQRKSGLWQSALPWEKPVSHGWLLFLTNMLDTELLKGAIFKRIHDILVSLHWKMIILGMQGTGEG